MRIAVTGSSGFIGGHLCDHLRAREHDVVRVVRGTAEEGQIPWAPDEGRLAPDAFDDCDAVVHLAGAGVGDRRWTESYKRKIRESRTAGTTLVASTIAAASHRPAVMLSSSGVDIYGDRGDAVITERSMTATGDSFLAAVCHDWEAATAPAAEAGVRVVNMRTGMVLGRDGGALARQLPLFRLGLGGQFGGGTQWQSWITIGDAVRAIEHLLTSALAGPVNLTAPGPVTNAEFTKTLAAVLHRPAVLPIPRFGPALLYGRELTDTLLYSGQRVMPAALLGDGFDFDHPTLDVALRAVLDR